MVESEKELESLLMRVKKESEKRRVKAGLKFSLIKSKIMAFIQSHHFMANRRGKVEAVTDLVFSGSKITAYGAFMIEYGQRKTRKLRNSPLISSFLLFLSDPEL